MGNKCCRSSAGTVAPGAQPPSPHLQDFQPVTPDSPTSPQNLRQSDVPASHFPNPNAPASGSSSAASPRRIDPVSTSSVSKSKSTSPKAPDDLAILVQRLNAANQRAEAMLDDVSRASSEFAQKQMVIQICFIKIFLI